MRICAQPTLHTHQPCLCSTYILFHAHMRTAIPSSLDSETSSDLMKKETREGRYLISLAGCIFDRAKRERRKKRRRREKRKREKKERKEREKRFINSNLKLSSSLFPCYASSLSPSLVLSEGASPELVYTTQ